MTDEERDEIKDALTEAIYGRISIDECADRLEELGIVSIRIAGVLPRGQSLN